ncbi:MAG TPA: type II toxin-antitoxin system HicB family antitoxin [Caulobacteraceae bacterium]|nr:type II toxin-antitoxin system HicB family antitoxin [Caulobacteraceae bacterium]
MPQRFYPAVLERGEGGALALWFPDFPGVVAGGRSQEDAMARAADALEEALCGALDRDGALPQPTAIDAIELPEECDFVAYVAVGATPPDPSERVNIYLPKSLIERVDREAAERGMSRSSYFGWAVSTVLFRQSAKPGEEPGWLVRLMRNRGRAR